MSKTTIYLKSGGNCDIETSETKQQVIKKYGEAFNPKKKVSHVVLESKKRSLIIPTENIAFVCVDETSD